MTAADPIKSDWIAHLTSTQPADRSRAEGAVRDLYAAAGLPAPRHLVWFQSPFAAAWAVALLAAPHHYVWSDIMADGARSKRLQPTLEQARTTLAEAIGTPDWQAVVAAVGAPLVMALHLPGAAAQPLHMPILEARMDLYGDNVGALWNYDENEPVTRAEHRWWTMSGAVTTQEGLSTIGTILSGSFFNDYSFASMAADESAVRGEPPALLAAAWEVARASGPWWPFAGGAVLAERPVEAHLDDAGRPHRGDGPALTFRDGSVAYAWEGISMPSLWLLEPHRITARDLKGTVPTFRKYVASRVAARA